MGATGCHFFGGQNQCEFKTSSHNIIFRKTGMTFMKNRKCLNENKYINFFTILGQQK